VAQDDAFEGKIEHANRLEKSATLGTEVDPILWTKKRRN